MQDVHSSNLLVVTGISDSSKSRARHHRSLKLGSRLKYLNQKLIFVFIRNINDIITGMFSCKNTCSQMTFFKHPCEAFVIRFYKKFHWFIFLMRKIKFLLFWRIFSLKNFVKLIIKIMCACSVD